jgi:hypothetical protein
MYAKFCFSGFPNCYFFGFGDGMTYGDATGFRTLPDARGTASPDALDRSIVARMPSRITIITVP